MALHNVPQGEEAWHVRDESCACRPAKTEGHQRVGAGRNAFPYRGTIYNHQTMPNPSTPGTPPELHDRIAVEPDAVDALGAADVLELPDGIAYQAPPADPESGPEAECGHVVVRTDAGDWQHHEIPDDSAPHAPTTECGCGPQADQTGPYLVIVHVDQDRDPNGDQDDDAGEG